MLVWPEQRDVRRLWARLVTPPRAFSFWVVYAVLVAGTILIAGALVCAVLDIAFAGRW